MKNSRKVRHLESLQSTGQTNTHKRGHLVVFYLSHTHTGHLHRNSHTHRVTFTLSHTDINIIEVRKNHLTTHLPLKMNILFPLFNCQCFTQYLLYTQYYSLSLSLSLSYTHTYTRMHTRMLTHTRMHTHTHTHTRLMNITIIIRHILESLKFNKSQIVGW